MHSHNQRIQLLKKYWRLIFLVPLLIFFIVVALRQPSHDREWREDFAVLPEVSILGNDFTIDHVRDWQYGLDTIALKEYTSVTNTIDNLETVWFLLEPFGSWDGVAHSFFLFDFKDGQSLSLSIEARSTVDEEYGAFRGLFKQYELMYMWGTREDFLNRRTLYLNHDVYMYPLLLSDEMAQKLLEDTLLETQSIESTPVFYNTFFTNCTNVLADHADRLSPGFIPYLSFARVLTGYADELLYEKKLIPHEQSFEEVRDTYYMTEKMREAYKVSKENS